MSRVKALGLAAIATAALALPAAAQGAGTSTLTPAAGSRFPERAYVLTLPRRAKLDRSAVTVSENGGPVRALRVAPVGAGRRARVGVLLALDTSASMRGRPLREAYKAVRAFARARNERQPLALLEFNGGSDVRMSFTTDKAVIHRAVKRSGGAGGGTHLYDAAMKSIEEVRSSGLTGGFVVLLSDGADRGSRADLRAVTTAAREAHVRLFDIGLRSKHFDSAALKRLARSTGGGYAEAGSARELKAIYRALGAQLSNGYLVRYKSLVAPRTRVKVRASVAGFGSAPASYVSPKLAAPKAAPAQKRWSSSSTPAVLAAVVVALLLGLAVALVLFRWRQTPRDRIAQFVKVPEADDARVTLAGRVVSGTERSLSGKGWWPSFEELLDIGGSRRSAAQVVAGSAAAALAVAIVAATVSGQALSALLVLLLAPLCVRGVVRSRAQRERRRFGEQLADHLAVVGGAMRAGHGLPAALTSVLDEAPEPARREFARAAADERLGAPLEESLELVAERMKNRDVEQVALLARLQREAGANAAEMLDRVVDTIRERQELRRSVRTLTAQGRMSRWILTGLPVVVLAGLTLTNRDYVDPLYHTGIGRFLLLISLLMLAAGSLVIKRIVNFEI